MRVVGGRFRGRTLATPGDDRTRPTSDRVRESVFNILVHSIDGFAIEGVRVLDLFAGTGALGLEALSRGAASCLFIEESAEGRGLIRTSFGPFQLLDLMPGAVEHVKRSVLREQLGRQAAGELGIADDDETVRPPRKPAPPKPKGWA